VAIRKFSASSLTNPNSKSSKLWDQETTLGTFESIATVTVDSGGASTISFSNIPQNYTHLQIRCRMRTGLAQTTLDTYMVINSISSYQYHYVYGNGSSAASGAGTFSKSLIGRATGSTATANTFAVSIVDILDYTNTNKNKTIRVLNGDENNGSGNVFFLSALPISSTDTITSLTFTAESASSFAQYSSFALYGIRGA
jgi:hypothetical protein